MELVDTTDLKSVAPKGRAGSSPAAGTTALFFSLGVKAIGKHILRIFVASLYDDGHYN